MGRLLSQLSKALRNPQNPAIREEVLVLAAHRECLIQVCVVTVGVNIEPRTAHRRRSPNTLMKKLAKIVCAPNVSNSAAGITSRIVCE